MLIHPLTADPITRFAFAERLIDERILLSGLHTVDEQHWHVITDLALAIECATSQHPPLPATVPWNDLRQHQASYIPWEKGLYLAWECGPGDALYSYLDTLGIADELAGDIDGDLYNICCAAHHLPQDAFWQSLQNVYAGGGWPCGWMESHPAEKLLVFSNQISNTSTRACYEL